MLNALGEEGNSGPLTVLARVPSGLGSAAEGGRAPAGSGAKGQAEGSARGAGAEAQVTRPSPPTRSSLAGAGASSGRPHPCCLHFSGRRRSWA